MAGLFSFEDPENIKGRENHERKVHWEQNRETEITVIDSITHDGFIVGVGKARIFDIDLYNEVTYNHLIYITMLKDSSETDTFWLTRDSIGTLLANLEHIVEPYSLQNYFVRRYNGDWKLPTYVSNKAVSNKLVKIIFNNKSIHVTPVIIGSGTYIGFMTVFSERDPETNEWHVISTNKLRVPVFKRFLKSLEQIMNMSAMYQFVDRFNSYTDRFDAAIHRFNSTLTEVAQLKDRITKLEDSIENGLIDKLIAKLVDTEISKHVRQPKVPEGQHFINRDLTVETEDTPMYDSFDKTEMNDRAYSGALRDILYTYNKHASMFDKMPLWRKVVVVRDYVDYMNWHTIADFIYEKGFKADGAALYKVLEKIQEKLEKPADWYTHVKDRLVTEDFLDRFEAEKLKDMYKKRYEEITVKDVMTYLVFDAMSRSGYYVEVNWDAMPDEPITSYRNRPVENPEPMKPTERDKEADEVATKERKSRDEFRQSQIDTYYKQAKLQKAFEEQDAKYEQAEKEFVKPTKTTETAETETNVIETTEDAPSKPRNTVKDELARHIKSTIKATTENKIVEPLVENTDTKNPQIIHGILIPDITPYDYKEVDGIIVMKKKVDELVRVVENIPPIDTLKGREKKKYEKLLKIKSLEEKYVDELEPGDIEVLVDYNQQQMDKLMSQLMEHNEFEIIESIVSRFVTAANIINLKGKLLSGVTKQLTKAEQKALEEEYKKQQEAKETTEKTKDKSKSNTIAGTTEELIKKFNVSIDDKNIIRKDEFTKKYVRKIVNKIGVIDAYEFLKTLAQIRGINFNPSKYKEFEKITDDLQILDEPNENSSLPEKITLDDFDKAAESMRNESITEDYNQELEEDKDINITTVDESDTKPNETEDVEDIETDETEDVEDIETDETEEIDNTEESTKTESTEPISEVEVVDENENHKNPINIEQLAVYEKFGEILAGEDIRLWKDTDPKEYHQRNYIVFSDIYHKDSKLYYLYDNYVYTDPIYWYEEVQDEEVEEFKLVDLRPMAIAKYAHDEEKYDKLPGSMAAWFLGHLDAKDINILRDVYFGHYKIGNPMTSLLLGIAWGAYLNEKLFDVFKNDDFDTVEKAFDLFSRNDPLRVRSILPDDTAAFGWVKYYEALAKNYGQYDRIYTYDNTQELFVTPQLYALDKRVLIDNFRHATVKMYLDRLSPTEIRHLVFAAIDSYMVHSYSKKGESPGTNIMFKDIVFFGERVFYDLKRMNIPLLYGIIRNLCKTIEEHDNEALKFILVLAFDKIYKSYLNNYNMWGATKEDTTYYWKRLQANLLHLRQMELHNQVKVGIQYRPFCPVNLDKGVTKL